MRKEMTQTEKRGLTDATFITILAKTFFSKALSKQKISRLELGKF